MTSETPSGMTLGYARVSTTAQDEALQVDALRAAGCDRGEAIDSVLGAPTDSSRTAEASDA